MFGTEDGPRNVERGRPWRLSSPCRLWLFRPAAPSLSPTPGERGWLRFGRSPELQDAGIDDARMTVTEEIYDYGAPVRVEAPPQEDTVDVGEFAERMRSRSS